MPVAFEYRQTEVTRFFSWLSILFYMANKVIKYIKFCCCSRQELFPCCANFGLCPWLLWSDLAQGLTFLNSYPSYSRRSHLNTDVWRPKRINSINESKLFFLQFIVIIDNRIKLWITNRDALLDVGFVRRWDLIKWLHVYTSILMLHVVIMVSCHWCMHFDTP